MGVTAVVQVAFLLVVILFLLGVAVSLVYRPSERKLGVLRPLSLALVFALVGAVCGGLATTFHAAVSRIAAGEAGKTVEIMLSGIAEALVPGAVGFAVLAIAWGLAAIGFRRLVP
jgi:hypothetical protein